MALLLHGDCLEKMKNLPSKSIDCFVCDLPYGCLSSSTKTERFRYYDGVRTDSILNTKLAGCGWDVKIDLPQFWEQVKRLAKNDHTPVIMFCSTRFGAELIMSNSSWFRHDLVWSKSNGVGFLSANKQPLRSHEMIYVFAKKGAYYKRVDIEGDFPATVKSNHKRSGTSNTAPRVSDILQPDRTGIRCVKSVVEISNKKGRGNHPTQKPAELYKWILERYCPPGGTMLDPTAGSFASVFTARAMGIHAIGIEMDDKFFWKAVQRSHDEIL